VPALRHSVSCTELQFTKDRKIHVFRKFFASLFLCQGAAWSFLSPLGYPWNGARCAASSQARQRPCCAVHRSDAGWRASQRRAAPWSLSFVVFSAKSWCVLCRLPAVALTVVRSELLKQRAVPAVFPVRIEWNDRLVALGQPVRAGLSKRGALERITAEQVLHLLSAVHFVEFLRNWSTQ